MLERRLDHEAPFGCLDFDIKAASPEPLGLFPRVLEFVAVLVQLQDAARIKIVANAGIAAQLTQLLAAVKRERESGIRVAAGPGPATIQKGGAGPQHLAGARARAAAEP